MVFVNDGIEEIQGTAMRNNGGETPKYLSFAGSDNTYDGTESIINSEWIRKELTWVQTGINSKYTVELTSVEAIGSQIKTLAGFGDTNIGTASDVLFFTDQSFIGSKSSDFNVQVEGEIIFRRPMQ